jgi:hypothetical protein
VNNPARVTGISPRTIPERSVSTIILFVLNMQLLLGNESLVLKKLKV